MNNPNVVILSEKSLNIFDLQKFKIKVKQNVVNSFSFGVSN